MDPITQQVLERFNYEKILYTTGLAPRRKRIYLADVFHAIPYETRIAQVLPGLLVFKPTAITNGRKDLVHYPQLQKMTQNLFNEAKRPREFMGIPTEECAKAALAFKNYLEAKKIKQKSRTITLRLSPMDYTKLTTLSKKRGWGYSETIRHLVEHA